MGAAGAAGAARTRPVAVPGLAGASQVVPDPSPDPKPNPNPNLSPDPSPDPDQVVCGGAHSLVLVGAYQDLIEEAAVGLTLTLALALALALTLTLT